MTHTIDVCIVTYRSADTITRCLQSLNSSTIATVTVIDHHGDCLHVDGSHTPSGVVIRAHADLTNPGFGTGMNNAARNGNAPFILFLNPDAAIHPGALEIGLHALTANATVAAVTGRIVSSDGHPERAGGRGLTAVHMWGRALAAKHLLRKLAKRTPLTQRLPRSYRRPKTEYVPTLTAAALLIRREAFEQVNGFDERIHLYGEDMDLCERLRQDNWRLLLLNHAWAVHDHGHSFTDFWAREIAYWSGMATFAQIHWNRTQRLLGAAAATVMALRAAAWTRNLRTSWQLLRPWTTKQVRHA